VDLEWSPLLPGGFTYGSPQLATIPGSPQSLIVWTPGMGVTIFDGANARPVNSLARGFSLQDAPAFVTASRIYLNRPNPGCWQWMTFYEDGIAGGSPACSTELPPDAVRETGFLYLRDGERTYPVSFPSSSTAPGTEARYMIDLPRRRAFQLNGLALIEYGIDDLQQRVRTQLLASSAGLLLPGADGAALIVGFNVITAIR
jgi:hypothetical protein